MHDSEIIVKKKNVIVKIDSIDYNISTMRDTTDIERMDLGLFAKIMGTKAFNCSIGESDILDVIPDFIYKSLIDESHLSAIFLLNNSQEMLGNINKKYDLEISVDSLAVNGRYLFLDENNNIAYPAIAKCQFTMILRKNDEIVYSQQIVQKAYTKEKAKRRYTNFVRLNSSNLQEQYATDMVKALSTAIKNSISEVIHNINVFIQQNENDLITIKEISVQDIRQKQYEHKIIKIPSGFLIFNINENNIINGKLVNFDQNNFYVENEKTLYTIKRKNIISITDRNLNIIAEDDLLQNNFPRINYNKYLEFKEIE